MMAVRQSEREKRGNGSKSGTCTRTWCCIGAGDCRLNHAVSEGHPWNGMNRYYGHMNGRERRWSPTQARGGHESALHCTRLQNRDRGKGNGRVDGAGTRVRCSTGRESQWKHGRGMHTSALQHGARGIKNQWKHGRGMARHAHESTAARGGKANGRTDSAVHKMAMAGTRARCMQHGEGKPMDARTGHAHERAAARGPGD